MSTDFFSLTFLLSNHSSLWFSMYFWGHFPSLLIFSAPDFTLSLDNCLPKMNKKLNSYKSILSSNDLLRYQVIIIKLDYIDKLRSNSLGEIITQGFDFKWFTKISVSINECFPNIEWQHGCLILWYAPQIDPLKAKPCNDTVNQTTFTYEYKHLCGWQSWTTEPISEIWVRIFEDKTFLKNKIMLGRRDVRSS